MSILLFVALLLFLPIYLKANAHYDLNRRKLGFAVYLYGFIRILGGYLATYTGGLALHLSNNKAVIVPYSNINKERKRFSFMKTFHVTAFTLTTETGAEYLLPIAIVHAVLRIYYFIKGGKKEGIENNLWLTDGDVLRISISTTVQFNLYMLICAFINFLKEKIKILWQKKMKKSTI